MKLLYLLAHNLRRIDGICAKVQSQIMVWREKGHDVRLFVIAGKSGSQQNIPEAEIYIRHDPITGSSELFSEIERFDPQLLMMRFEPYKPYLGKLMRKYPTILELNTIDPSEFALSGFWDLRRRIRHLYNLSTRSILFNKAAGFTAVTPEILESPWIRTFRKPAVHIPNSLLLKDHPVLKKIKKNRLPQIIFSTGGNYPWNGLDKLIILAERTVGKLEFQVIGLQAPRKRIPSNLHFHGYLSPQAHDQILAGSDLGLGVMSLHKKQMQQASPLRTRHYLAAGLPVILPYRDSAFMDEKNMPEWILSLPNRDNNIEDNIARITDFAYRMKNRIVDHSEVHSYIDATIWEEKRLDFFTNLLRSDSN